MALTQTFALCFSPTHDDIYKLAVKRFQELNPNLVVAKNGRIGVRMTEQTFEEMAIEEQQGLRPKGNTEPGPFTMEEVAASEKITNINLLERIRALMVDKSFLIDVASHADQAYRDAEIARKKAAGETIDNWLNNPLFSDEERTLLTGDASNYSPEQNEMLEKAQSRLAINLAGFYALSEGLDMSIDFSPDNRHVAFDCLRRIVDAQETDTERSIMSHFAHATWAAGQAFRRRETRPVMMPYSLLPVKEKAKDMVQIRAVAKVLLSRVTDN